MKVTKRNANPTRTPLQAKVCLEKSSVPVHD
jgi:hypothetical protein